MAGDDDEVRITLRMPSSLRDRLQTSADRSNRSMNGEIVEQLEKALSRYGTKHEVLYILLDADGYPISWDEILTHLSRISNKGGFDPAVVTGHVFNADITENEEREENWLDLVQHYRRLKGLEAD